MLADKYLPVFHFKTRHAISIAEPPSTIDLQNLSTKTDHWLVRILFRIRGVRLSKNAFHLHEIGFTLLEEVEQQEIAYGIISPHPYFGSCLADFEPSEFQVKYQQGFLRGLIVFGISGEGKETKLFTETRVHCGSRKILQRFRVYWFFVKPFSSLIRRIMLKEIQKSIQH